MRCHWDVKTERDGTGVSKMCSLVIRIITRSMQTKSFVMKYWIVCEKCHAISTMALIAEYSKNAQYIITLLSLHTSNYRTARTVHTYTHGLIKKIDINGIFKSYDNSTACRPHFHRNWKLFVFYFTPAQLILLLSHLQWQRIKEKLLQMFIVCKSDKVK